MNPELLIPAGDLERLKYALAYGADAVYAGAPRYSLRMRENGFHSIENISEAIEFTHEKGKKIYLAMNIFAHNSKIESMLRDFCIYDELGPDGYIVSDPGVISKMLKLRPKARIHLSTQANATNWATVEFFRDLGVKRVVIPRELSISEIEEIHRRVPDIELESFIHGSMCMAYSGRCLISNYLTHRDSNQGNCANSCRWQYKLSSEKKSLRLVEEEFEPKNLNINSTDKFFLKESGKNEKFEVDEDENGTYFFNSKDLCAVEILEQLQNAGVTSFKVEGRTKSVFYVATVTKAYRQAIDDMQNGKEFDPNILDELISTSNRSLMTGFFLRKPNEYGQNYADGGSHPLTHQFAGKIISYDKQERLATIEVNNKISLGDKLMLTSPSLNQSVTVEKLYNHKGLEVSEISGGMMASIFIASEPPVFSLLKKAISC